MRIERVVALTFAGAVFGVAGAACEVTVEGAAGTPKSPQAASASARPAAPPPPTAAPAPAASHAPAPAPTAPAKTIPLHLGGGAAPAPAGPAGTPSTAPPAAACLDQGAAAAGDCAALPAPSPSCAAFTVAQQKCGAYKASFAPKVGAAAVACLASSAPAQLCDPARPLACAKAALAQACPDPNVSQLCQIAAVPCKTSAADCSSMLSGLSSQGQQSVAQCVATGCAAGLAGCIDALK